jgi:AcrR family transcriptional regulator
MPSSVRTVNTSDVVRRPGGRTHDHSVRIFNCVLEILGAEGYAALTFQNVAEKAEVSRSTLYRRWPTRADMVLDAIATSIYGRIQIADTGSLAGDLKATLTQMGRVLMSPVGAGALAAVAEIGRGAPESEHRRQMWDKRFADFSPLFENARRRGEIAKSFDTEAALAMLAGGLYYRVLVMARDVDKAWIDRMVRLFLAMSANTRDGPRPKRNGERA